MLNFTWKSEIWNLSCKSKPKCSYAYLFREKKQTNKQTKIIWTGKPSINWLKYWHTYAIAYPNPNPSYESVSKSSECYAFSPLESRKRKSEMAVNIYLPLLSVFSQMDLPRKKRCEMEKENKQKKKKQKQKHF